MGDSLIKAWREYLGLTQEELAAKAGIQQPEIAIPGKRVSLPSKTASE
jgi:transcriptional regulator with XRE-family HTH domain